eukprot:PLAT301.1.p1 GENE.PLAT301.1~~PLAT301.1.p1  ORF type:complete len:507 (+),score=143.57 PLAT301.1:226-1746(+)
MPFDDGEEVTMDVESTWRAEAREISEGIGVQTDEWLLTTGDRGVQCVERADAVTQTSERYTRPPLSGDVTKGFAGWVPAGDLSEFLVEAGSRMLDELETSSTSRALDGYTLLEEAVGDDGVSCLFSLTSPWSAAAAASPLEEAKWGEAAGGGSSSSGGGGGSAGARGKLSRKRKAKSAALRPLRGSPRSPSGVAMKRTSASVAELTLGRAALAGDTDAPPSSAGSAVAALGLRFGAFGEPLGQSSDVSAPHTRAPPAAAPRAPFPARAPPFPARRATATAPWWTELQSRGSCSTFGCGASRLFVQANGLCVRCNRRRAAASCLNASCGSPAYLLQGNGFCALCNAQRRDGGCLSRVCGASAATVQSNGFCARCNRVKRFEALGLAVDDDLHGFDEHRACSVARDDADDDDAGHHDDHVAARATRRPPARGIKREEKEEERGQLKRKARGTESGEEERKEEEMKREDEDAHGDEEENGRTAAADAAAAAAVAAAGGDDARRREDKRG